MLLEGNLSNSIEKISTLLHTYPWTKIGIFINILSFDAYSGHLHVMKKLQEKLYAVRENDRIDRSVVKA